MSTETIAGEQRVLLRSISWKTYETLADNPDSAGRLLTYDKGLLEIMSPSRAHESDRTDSPLRQGLLNWHFYFCERLPESLHPPLDGLKNQRFLNCERHMECACYYALLGCG
jgi:hypothetical protein